MKHIWEHADTYGVDKHRIAVSGGSAGGNLSAILALRSRDEGVPLIALQVLIVPALLVAKNGPPGYAWDPSEFVIAPEMRKYVPEIKDPQHCP